MQSLPRLEALALCVGLQLFGILARGPGLLSTSDRVHGLGMFRAWGLRLFRFFGKALKHKPGRNQVGV